MRSIIAEAMVKWPKTLPHQAKGRLLDPVACLGGLDADAYGEVRLPCSGWAEQDDILALGQEPAGAQVGDQGSIGGRNDFDLPFHEHGLPAPHPSCEHQQEAVMPHLICPLAVRSSALGMSYERSLPNTTRIEP